MTKAKMRDQDVEPVVPTKAQVRDAADRAMVQAVVSQCDQITAMRRELGELSGLLAKTITRISALEEAVTNARQKLTNLRQGIIVPHVRDEDNIRT